MEAKPTNHIFRVSLNVRVYRDIEIPSTATLYAFAGSITKAFDFDFDHAFGFFSKLAGIMVMIGISRSRSSGSAHLNRRRDTRRSLRPWVTLLLNILVLTTTMRNAKRISGNHHRGACCTGVGGLSQSHFIKMATESCWNHSCPSRSASVVSRNWVAIAKLASLMSSPFLIPIGRCLTHLRRLVSTRSLSYASMT